MSFVSVHNGKPDDTSPSCVPLTMHRVNVGGKLDVMCFDKTGTLTEDGLDVLGVRVIHRPAMRHVECSYILEAFADPYQIQ